jgi:DNA repair exonuclease SbcCD nuclease subunit
LAGFDKMRKSEVARFAEKFTELDRAAQKHNGHKILVMHQGISEINQFASELSSTDLPRNFTYYAMGHLHDRVEKNFSCLGGPLAYPGSIEMTTSEGIKETQKGFYEVDISSPEARPSWIKLDTRPHLSVKTEFEKLADAVNDTLDTISKYAKKPIVELKISGNEIRVEAVQLQLARLIPHTLHCTWKVAHRGDDGSSVLSERPSSIDDELFRLATSHLGSEKLARFAVRDLLPVLASGKIDEAGQLIAENFEQFKVTKK